MKIPAEGIDAAEVRAVLKGFGLDLMEGSNNDAFEYFVNGTGHPFYLPYFKRGDKSQFLKAAYEALVEELSS